MALCEQIVSIDVNVQIERVIASISDTELLDKITECVKIQIGAYEDVYKRQVILCAALLCIAKIFKQEVRENEAG